jgi:ABC-type multidrug transport system ATPase subunit
VSLATQSVQELSFDVRAGTIVGFLGRNGAGKSTTLKMLAGLSAPTSGTATHSGRWRRGSVNAPRGGEALGCGALAPRPVRRWRQAPRENLEPQAERFGCATKRRHKLGSTLLVLTRA